MIRLDEHYLTFIRSRPCSFCGKAPVDAAHLRNRKWRETTRDDYTAIPLCREHHSLQHSVGLSVALTRCNLTPTNLAVVVTDLLVEFFTRSSVEVGI